MAKDPTAPKAPKKPRDPNAPKKPVKKSPLRVEVERVAKATGLPTSYINKQVSAAKKAIDQAKKNELAALATQVPSLVAQALQRAAAPAAPPAAEGEPTA